MKAFLIDNNVLSDLNRQFGYATQALRKLDITGDPAVCIVTYMEFMNQTLPKYLLRAKKFLDTFPFLPTTYKTDEYAQTIAAKGLIKHKGHVQDRLIAATALAYDIPLVTANMKDFTGLHRDLQLIPYTQYSTYFQQGGQSWSATDETSKSANPTAAKTRTAG